MGASAKKNERSIFQRFFRTETLSGLVLLLFGLAALAIANSPLADGYEKFWHTPITIIISDRTLSLNLHALINDGLMAVFFLLVGLEIKRELLAGELSSPKQAALPIVCAVGGMIVPAGIYLILNLNGAGSHGWGIPMATDIAFALGVLSLIAPRAPIGAKVFLTALAIVDDMGAILIIAIFYSSHIAWGALAAAASVFVLLIGLNVTGIRSLWPYSFLGFGLWYFIYESGVHPTVAGVLVAFAIPAHTRINAAEFSREARLLLDKFDRTETGDLLVLTSKGQQETLFALEHASEAVTSPILRLEHTLHNLSAFVVMPLFAFANAGLKIGGPVKHVGIVLGVMIGLVVGKPLGITAAALIGVKSGVAALPAGVRWRSLIGCACLAGIGFTVSLFISMMAFSDTSLIEAAKIGILSGSLLAGLIATVILRARGHVDRSQPSAH